MPHDISVKKLVGFLEKVPWDKVAKKAPNTPRGQRLFPSRTPKNDKGMNFRLDRGSDVNGEPQIIVQANKNADDVMVKQAAQKDSHAILAEAVLDTKKDKDGKSAKALLTDSFQLRKDKK
jgi:hypothetical protein